jgi:hypothetical protein
LFTRTASLAKVSLSVIGVSPKRLHPCYPRNGMSRDLKMRKSGSQEPSLSPSSCFPEFHIQSVVISSAEFRMKPGGTDPGDPSASLPSVKQGIVGRGIGLTKRESRISADGSRLNSAAAAP